MQAALLLSAFAKGVIVGIVIALPVGPVGMLCVRRTLFEGVRFGVASGVGAAAADTMFGLIAGFGLSAVRDWVLGYEDWLGAAGGIYLVYAGARALAAKPAGEPEPLSGERLRGAFASAFLLTVTNPVTILSLAAIFAKLGIDPAASLAGIDALVGGVFAGSTASWLALALSVAMVRRRAGRVTLGWINRISGAILLLSGMALLTIVGISIVARMRG